MSSPEQMPLTPNPIFKTAMVLGTWRSVPPEHAPQEYSEIVEPLMFELFEEGRVIPGLMWGYSGGTLLCDGSARAWLSQISQDFEFLEAVGVPSEFVHYNHKTSEVVFDIGYKSKANTDYSWARPKSRVWIDPIVNGMIRNGEEAYGREIYVFKRTELKIRRSELGGAKAFNIANYGPNSHDILVVEELKNALAEAGCENLAFRVAGELIDWNAARLHRFSSLDWRHCDRRVHAL